MSAANDTQAAPVTDHAPQLLAELKLADHIIKAMLAAMTIQQKARVAEQLEAAGVVSDGMSRHHERHAVIAAVESASPAATGRMAVIAERASSIVGDAREADALMQGDGAAAAVVHLIARMRRAAQTITTLAVQGGAA